MEEQERGIVVGTSERMLRDYRKGNWTIQETLILIEAKKMDDQRRKATKKQVLYSEQSSTTTPSSGLVIGKPPVTELRWKWVEDYCWRKGCYRSQNQCNDKWDNLMRDYKKVREYQRNMLGSADVNAEEKEGLSYWKMDKVERKDKGLPTNMLYQIYQALFDVVERAASPTHPTTLGLPSPVGSPPPPRLLLSPLSRPQVSPIVVVPSIPHPQHGFQLGPQLAQGAETSEQAHTESPSKRRKKDERAGGGSGSGAALGEGTSGAGGGGGARISTSARPLMTSSMEEVGSAINRIVEALQGNEEREERRHREMMRLHETRLRLDESRLEIHRQSLHSMLDAIHKLTTSFQTWANKNQGPP